MDANKRSACVKQDSAKNVWILIKCDELAGNLEPHNKEGDICTANIKNISLPSGIGCREMRKMLLDAAGAHDDDRLVLKLRNHRGSLIPTNNNLLTNSRTAPYVLELVEQYKHVHPMDKTIKCSHYDEGVKTTLLALQSRLEDLQKCIPELDCHRQQTVQQDIQDLERKIQFLNKRFDEAEHIHWKGMFKKQPLW